MIDIDPSASSLTPYNKPLTPYVCSTSEDFVAEREYLNDNVFPILAALCEQRGTHFSPVNLIWDKNSPQAVDGAGLHSNLSLIKYCAPYFICLLGERFGYHRKQDAPKLPKRIQDLTPENDFIDKNIVIAGKCGFETVLDESNQSQSLTEMEINNGTYHSSSGFIYFYFRKQNHEDNLFTDLPESEREKLLKVYQSESEYADLRIKDLRQRIVKRGLPVKYFSSHVDLGRSVLDDWVAVINLLHPPLTKSLTLSKRTALIEDRSQFLYAESRRQIFIRTQKEENILTKMTDFALKSLDGADEYEVERWQKEMFGSPRTSPRNVRKANNKSILLITGVRGAGKSTLVCNWLKNFTEEYPEVKVIPNFIGSSVLSTDLSVFLSQATADLHAEYSENSTESDRNVQFSDHSNFKFIVQSFLSALSTGPSVIILDGIDRLCSTCGISIQDIKNMDWLPNPLPPQCRIIITISKSDQSFKVLSKRPDVTTYVHNPITDKETKTIYIQDHMANFGRRLHRSFIERIHAANMSDRPLFISSICKAFSGIDVWMNLEQYMEKFTDVRSVRELWMHIFKRWTRDYCWSVEGYKIDPNTPLPEIELIGWIPDALRLLAASRYGLTEMEILVCLERIGYVDDSAISDLDWAEFRLACWEMVVVGPNGKLGFGHQHFEESVQYAFLGKLMSQPHDVDQLIRTHSDWNLEPKKFHTFLASYFKEQPHGHQRVEELPWQLIMAGNLDDVHESLTEYKTFTFMMTASSRERRDLINYWKLLENNGKNSINAYESLLEQFEVGETTLPDSDNEDDEAKVKSEINQTFLTETGAEGESKKILRLSALTTLALNIGQLWHDLGHIENAKDMWVHDCEVLEKHFPLDHKSQIIEIKVNSNLSKIYLQWEQYNRAERYAQKALECMESLLLDESEEHLVTEFTEEKGLLYDRLGYIHFKKMDYASTEALLMKAKDTLEVICCQKGMATVIHHLGLLRSKQKNFVQAESCLREALKLRGKWIGLKHPLTANVMEDLALVLSSNNNKKGGSEESDAHFRACLSIREDSLGKSNLIVAQTLEHFGEILKSRGSHTAKIEGRKCLRRTLDIRTTLLGGEHPSTKKVRKSVAEIEASIQLGLYEFGPGVKIDTRNSELPYSTLSFRDEDLELIERAKSAGQRRSPARPVTADHHFSTTTYDVENQRNHKRLQSASTVNTTDHQKRQHSASSVNTTNRLYSKSLSNLRKSVSTAGYEPPNQSTRLQQRSNYQVKLAYPAENILIDQTTARGQVSDRDRSCTVTPCPVDVGKVSKRINEFSKENYIDNYSNEIFKAERTKSAKKRAQKSIRPHSAPVKDSFSSLLVKKTSNKSNMDRASRINSAVSFATTTKGEGHRSKCYVPGPHDISPSGTFSVHGPHSGITTLLELPKRRPHTGTYHTSAWYHVPGRYSTQKTPVPPKRSQSRVTIQMPNYNDEDIGSDNENDDSYVRNVTVEVPS